MIGQTNKHRYGLKVWETIIENNQFSQRRLLKSHAFLQADKAFKDTLKL